MADGVCVGFGRRVVHVSFFELCESLELLEVHLDVWDEILT